MKLGEKLRQARLEAGMTQKQLCEGIVTRNMLSQIENNAARPSMKTLESFARRLGKNISFFLEETAVLSANMQVMEEARARFDAEDPAGTLSALEKYQKPDGVYDREKDLLQALCLLKLAEQAIRDGKTAYARDLLENGEFKSTYCREHLERSRMLLMGSLPGVQVSELLPSLDEELLLRAGEALSQGKAQRAASLLDACEFRETPRWMLLRGAAWLKLKYYAQAKECLLAAETAYPRETAAYLEICFRELGDFQNAYLYACRQREKM